MPDTTPTARASAWLAALDAALARGDAQAAANLFDDVYKDLPEHLRRQRQEHGV